MVSIFLSSFGVPYHCGNKQPPPPPRVYREPRIGPPQGSGVTTGVGACFKQRT